MQYYTLLRHYYHLTVSLGKVASTSFTNPCTGGMCKRVVGTTTMYRIFSTSNAVIRGRDIKPVFQVVGGINLLEESKWSLYPFPLSGSHPPPTYVQKVVTDRICRKDGDPVCLNLRCRTSILAIAFPLVVYSNNLVRCLRRW